jgi:hypothetical protein
VLTVCSTGLYYSLLIASAGPLLFSSKKKFHPFWAPKARISFQCTIHQKQFSTLTRLQKSIVTKLYVEIGHISNQQKAEFVDDIFHIQSFWGGRGNILPKSLFMPEGQVCPDFSRSSNPTIFR